MRFAVLPSAAELMARTLEHTPGGHPHNQQSHAGDGAPAARDVLGIAKRIVLSDGETFIASESGKIQKGRDEYGVPMALVNTPDGPRLRLGEETNGEATGWEVDVYSVRAELDPAGIRRMRDNLDVMVQEWDRHEKHARELGKRVAAAQIMDRERMVKRPPTPEEVADRPGVTHGWDITYDPPLTPAEALLHEEWARYWGDDYITGQLGEGIGWALYGTDVDEPGVSEKVFASIWFGKEPQPGDPQFDSRRDVRSFQKRLDDMLQLANDSRSRSPESLAVAMPTAAELVSRALEKYNPLQPRDADGQWTDGMPDDLVSIPVKVMGGSVTASARRGSDGKATLSANGRSVDLDSRELRELRSQIINAQYGDDSKSGSDGVFRVTRSETGDDGKAKTDILVSLRPVEGALISETGKKVSSYDDAPDEEVYNAEFDMVVAEGADGEFGDYPSTRVSLKDLEPDDNLKGFYSALERATAASRIDTGNGPTDVFSPRAGVVGFRMKDDNGNPTEVTFNAGEARRLKSAIEDVLYGEDEGVGDLSIPRDERMTFETSGGPVEVRFRGRMTNRDWEGTLTLLPEGAPWSVAVDGPSIDEFMGAFNQSGAMAGIRAFESDESALGVHSMPLFRALEAFSVMSPSPAVRLMMLARALEADDSFMRKGDLITVNRGSKGRFARKVGSAIDAAAAVRAMVDTPKKPRAPRNAVAKALASGDSSALDGMSRESLRREAKARGIDVPRGVSEDVLKDMLWDDENSSKGDGAASAMADGFGGTSASGGSPMRNQIIDAYDKLRGDSEWVDLSRLRRELGGTREEQDAALRDLFPDPAVAFIPEENQKTLTDARRAAAIRIGGESNHLIGFVNQKRPARVPDPQAPRTADQMRSRADSLLSDMPSDQAGRDRVHKEVGGLILDADRMDAASPGESWAARHGIKLDPAFKMDPSPFSPEKMGLVASAKPSRSRAKAADTDAVADRIRALPHKPESRAALAAELDQLGAADMRAVADKWNIPLPKRTTKAQSRQAIETRLEQLIDHDSVLNGGWDGGRQPATPPAPDKPLSFFGQMKQAHADAMAADMAARAARKAAAEKPKRASRAKGPTAEERRDNAIAIMGGRNVWAGNQISSADWSAPKTDADAPKRPRRALAPKPKPLTDDERRANAAAISGGENVFAKMRAEDDAKRASTVKAGLLAATSTDGARQYLADLKLSAAELKQIATELDVPTGGGSKGIRDALVKIFATGRLTNDIFPALRGGPNPKA